MPRNGGRCRKLWKETAVAIVHTKRNMMPFAPRFMVTAPESSIAGISRETARDMIDAGTI